jgi:short subunit dehydrogenase-like uncharacterized protein
MNRTFDIILFGATGFTGQIIARYLAQHAPKENLTWAIAGRDKEKLVKLSEGLHSSQPAIMIADVNDVDSLMQMTSKCQILMNAAGPFSRYGKGVVYACIENSTHYLDITGEPSFIADIYNNYFERAVDKKSCVVNCCGFDSIPADYAAFLTAKKLPLNEPKTLKAYLRTNATFSGGTLTTAIEALYLETQKKSIKTKIKRHPDAPKIPIKIHYNTDVNGWGIPMPVVDPHIVKRSAYRLPNQYGEAVSYAQFFVRSSLFKVFKTVMPIALASVLVRFKGFRDKMFNKFKPGSGPSDERRAKSKFEVVCYGSSTTSKAISKISGADPGYDETAKMFCESAFTLADHIKNQSIKYGVLTPVEAFGIPMVDRLIKAGIHIE